MFAFDPSDSTQNCSVVAYDSLFYSGSGGTGSCNLLANVGYLNTSGNSYNIYGTSSGGNVTYSYLSINSNSFTLYPNTNFVSINVPTLGTTQVCYYVEDSSATGFCYDSSCVIISPSNPSNACAANILLWQDSVNTMTWYGYNLATGAQPLTYFWSFGDGTSSNQAFPSHTYAVPGTYVICLTITDNNGCTSTSCDSSMAFRLNNSNSQNSVSQISILNPLGLSEISPIKNASVFPNPIIDQANLSFTCENSSNASIQVRNVFGSLLSETNLITKQGNNNSELNFSGIPNGVYFVDIRIEGKLKQTLKVIK
jgi:hypothetical protein